MERSAIIRRLACDVGRFPLSALEARLLARLDSRLTLEEVAEALGVDVALALQAAETLVRFGVVAEEPLERATAVRARFVLDAALAARAVPGGTSVRRDARASFVEEAAPRSGARPSSPRAPDPEPCDLDEATALAITALHAKLADVDDYALLEVGRDADAREIELAYAAYAARLHPDRFADRRLGALAVPLDRVHRRMTNARDRLLSPQRRATYDANLGPAREAPPAKVRASDDERSARVPAISAPPSVPVKAAPSPEPARPRSVPPAPAEVGSATSGISRPPDAGPPSAPREDRVGRLREAAHDVRRDARIELLLRAADDALRTEAYVVAANNLRLALVEREDPQVRRKLESVDAYARDIRVERGLALATAAERELRWSDAAVHLARAHQVRNDAAVAARAAHAYRMAGELESAADLAEQAVRMANGVAEYRLTLAQVLVAANELGRASETVAAAIAIAPTDARLKHLADLIARKRENAR